MTLKVDGETDKCSRAEDINFEMIGFSVFGQVDFNSQGARDFLRTLNAVKLVSSGDLISTERGLRCLNLTR